jgi:Spy/CpxP family protein refolding chaperone
MLKRVSFLFVMIAFIFPVCFCLAQSRGKAKPDKALDWTEELDKELQFSDYQRQQVKEIFTKAREETLTILNDASRKVTEIRHKATDDISYLLTPTQKEKFKQLRKEYESPPRIKE